MTDPWLDDGDVRLYLGDALGVLRTLPWSSVHCIVTSPPFWNLRDYEVEGQLGAEATAGEWAARLVEVFGAARRVLRDDGVMFVEIGDSYDGGKQLVGQPWRLAFALQEDGWLLRSEIIWHRPNPMPESVTDRPTRAHSTVFLLSKRPRYYWDAEAVREEALGTGHGVRLGAGAGDGPTTWERPGVVVPDADGGRNVRSVWTISPEPSPIPHYAMFPQGLVERCLKAGTSERGACVSCRAPWRRVVERKSVERHELAPGNPNYRPSRYTAREDSPYAANNGQRFSSRSTLGWEPSCECEIPTGPLVRPCVVLDPFMGTGTTALVARRLGRHAVGVELSEVYMESAAKRLQQLSLLA